MHYIIYGKYHNQNRLLPNNVKVYLWNKDSLNRLFGNKYKHHPLKDNQHKTDILFFEKSIMYRIDDQYHEDGSIIMIDPLKPIDNIVYPSWDITQKSLSVIINESFDKEMVIDIIDIN
jgi:hypothetical protein